MNFGDGRKSDDTIKRQLIISRIIYFAAAFPIIIALVVLIGFPHSLLVGLPILLLLAWVVQRWNLMKVGARTSMFHDRSFDWYCMRCGNKHNGAVCNRCGSKARRMGF